MNNPASLLIPYNLVQGLRDAIVVVGSQQQDHRITVWNESAEKLYGWSGTEVIGKSLATILPPVAHLLQKEVLTGLVVREGVYIREVITTAKDGGAVVTEVHLSPLYDDEQNSIGFAMMHRQLVSREALVQREPSTRATLSQELTYQKQLLETVTQNTDMALFLMDEGQYCIYMNEAAERLTGFTIGELKGKRLHEFIHHTHPDGSPYPLEECPIDKALPTQKRMKGEEFFVHKDGSFYPVAFTASPIVIQGRSVGTVLEVRETSAEKRKEQDLKESEARFRTMAEGTSVLIAVANESSNAIYFNKAWTDLTGRSMQELIDYGWADLVHPEDRDRFVNLYLDAFAKHEAFNGEFRLLTNEGQYCWLLAQGPPRFRDDGSFAGYISSCVDITERKRLEEQLKEQYYELENIYLNSPIGLGIIDENFHFVRINEKLAEINGIAAKDHIGRPIEAIVPDLAAQAKELFQRVFATGEPILNVEISGTTLAQPGVTRVWRESWHPVKDQEGRTFAISIVVEEITDQKRAREALLESEQRFRSIAADAPAFIFIGNANAEIEYINNTWIQFTGFSPHEALGQAWAKITHPDDLQPSFDIYTNAVNQQRPYQYEMRQLGVDGQYHTILWRGIPRFMPDGKFLGILGFGFDITDIKNAQHALEQSERRFRQIIQSNIIPAFYWDLDKGIVDANNAFLHLLGYSFEEMIGKINWLDVTPPGFEELDQKGVAELVANGHHLPFEKQYLHKSGRLVDVIVGSTAFDGTGNRQGITFVLDITERKQLEGALRQAEERVRSFILQAPVAMGFYRGPELVVELANEALLKFWGKTAVAALNKPVFEAVPEAKGQGYEALFEQVIRTGERYTAYGSPVVLPRNGKLQTVYVDIVYEPYREADGTISGVVEVVNDVTERVLAVEAIKTSEARFRNILEQAPDPILVMKGEELVLDIANEPLFRLWQIDASSIGKPFLKLLPEMKEQGFWDMLMDVYHHGKTIKGFDTEAVFHRENGIKEKVYFNFVYTPYRETDGRISGVMVIATDVTGSVLARKHLVESESRFRMLAETFPQMVWTVTSDGTTEFVSKKWLEYSGIEDVQEAWRWMTHPEDWEGVMQSWQQHFTAQKPFRHEVRLRNKKGEYRWHQTLGEPLFNEEGKLVKWIGVVTDIHAQKTFTEQLEKLVADRTSELAQANRELLRSNEDLQQFAHVASHDLREPVRKVMTFTNRIQYEFDAELPEKVKTYLSKIESAARRSYAMIDGVLSYSTVGTTEQNREPVDLNGLLRSIENDLEVTIQNTGARLEYSRLPNVMGTPAMLHQLFYNLIGNALKFSQPGQLPLIRIEATIPAADELAHHLLDNSQQFTKIICADNGIGFPPQFAQTIFGAFSRLHSRDMYEGTGLGLALCQKIVERHGGAIWAESEEGKGASFIMLLPQA